MGTIPLNEQQLLNGQIIRINSPDDYPQEAVEERRAQSAEGHFSDLTVPVRTKDGIWNCIEMHSHERPVTWSDDDVARLGMVSEAVATALERKETMEVLRKSEEKFSRAFHASPVAMAIVSLATRRCIEVNRAYQENTGFRAEEIIGRSGELGIYTGSDGPGNIDELLIEREGLRNIELQYRSKGGDLRTALLSTELIEFGGEPCSLLVLEDITERKHIEQGSRELGARILLVQEEERRRVARELHDDFSQRLALLAIDLEQLAQRPPSAGHEWSARLESMWSQTQELTSDLHRLSYQLHPSKLEDLGLVTAVRSYCHGLRKQAGLEVRFSDANVPRALPKEISLCLYRIVQEALHNVVKHSGVKTATVDLSGGANEVRLVISDSGRGFVINAAPGSDGLGLISMQERVRHVGGLWSIESHPFGGTRIVVRIPVPSHSARQHRIAG
jgi:PAS domain S-box-containing protein